MSDKTQFHHESLQDVQTVQQLLEALTEGIGKGHLTLSDDGQEMVLHPQGLLNLKIRALQEDDNNRINIRISWQSPQQNRSASPLKVK